MARAKVEKVSPKSVKKGLAKPKGVHTKPVVSTREERTELVKAAARLAIEMHKDALKELEHY